MTLEELDLHRDLVIQLNTTKDILQSLKTVLHAASLDGMPRTTGSSGRSMDALAIKLIDQEEKVKQCDIAVKKSEPFVLAYIDAIPDARVNMIFWLRFIAGYTWQEVADAIGGRNTQDAVKSACYRYLNDNP